MRALSPTGISLLFLGAYVFSSGSRYLIPGGCIALAGLVMLALAVVVDPAVRDKATERETESTRSRRGAIGEATETQPSEEMDQATA